MVRGLCDSPHAARSEGEAYAQSGRIDTGVHVEAQYFQVDVEAATDIQRNTQAVVGVFAIFIDVS